MRLAVLQGLFNRPGGVALGLEVLWEIDQEVLDGPRRRQASERARRREAEAALLRESDSGSERHTTRSSRLPRLLKERVRPCFRIG